MIVDLPTVTTVIRLIAAGTGRSVSATATACLPQLVALNRQMAAELRTTYGVRFLPEQVYRAHCPIGTPLTVARLVRASSVRQMANGGRRRKRTITTRSIL